MATLIFQFLFNMFINSFAFYQCRSFITLIGCWFCNISYYLWDLRDCSRYRKDILFVNYHRIIKKRWCLIFIIYDHSFIDQWWWFNYLFYYLGFLGLLCLSLSYRRRNLSLFDQWCLRFLTIFLLLKFWVLVLLFSFYCFIISIYRSIRIRFVFRVFCPYFRPIYFNKTFFK